MEPTEFSLREWGLKARMISREQCYSRRFSGSHIRSSFREADAYNARSFRSTFTVSSTASSPGCAATSKDKIDPSTYSFTAALKALQAKSSYNCWECLSPDGFALNSKWNDAEKYISNPLSGEVPMECLSAKTLSARSFRHYSNRITMSAPLVYSSTSKPMLVKPDYAIATPSTSNSTVTQESGAATVPPPVLQEKKLEGTMKDVGIQSATSELCSSSPSPALTPSIVERSLKRFEAEDEDEDSPHLASKIQAKEEGDEWTDTKREEERWKCSREVGCLSWMRRRMREKHKSRKKNITQCCRFKGSLKN